MTLSDSHCADCHQQMVTIGTHAVREQLMFQPAKLYREQLSQTTYRCPNCSVTKGNDQLVHAPAPVPLISHSLATPSLVTEVIHKKFELAVPLYRQIKDWANLGLQVTEPTLSNWVIRASEWLTPIKELLHKRLMQQAYVHGDETPLQVLREPGKLAPSKSFLWLVNSAKNAVEQIVDFNYDPSQGGSVAQRIYQSFTGTLLCDGYYGYNSVNPVVTRAACWSHVRRKFFDAAEGIKTDQSQAHRVVELLDKLFRIERLNRDIPPEDLLQVRKDQSKLLVDRFFEGLRSICVNRNSKFGRAVNYARKLETELRQFLVDPQGALDNNLLSVTSSKL